MWDIWNNSNWKYMETTMLLKCKPRTEDIAEYYYEVWVIEDSFWIQSIQIKQSSNCGSSGCVLRA